MNETDLFGGIFQGMTPEQKKQALASILHTGTLGQENDALDEQLQQAIALRKPDTQQHYGLAGGISGAVSGLGRGIFSSLQEKDLRAQQAEKLKQIEASRGRFADLLGQSQAPQQGQYPAPYTFGT